MHTGAKYMDQLMTRYFKDAKFTEAHRTLFAFASEVVVAEKIGREPTTYVRNIYKYYVAYSLMLEAHETRKAARDQVAPVKR